MTYRRIIPRRTASGWYVRTPGDLFTPGSQPKRRFFQDGKEAADYARQLNDARRGSLQFFFAMHPAALSELALRIRELGYDRAIAALRRARAAVEQSERPASDVFAQFLADKSKTVRGNTLRSLRSIIRPLAAQDKPIAEYTRADIEAHLRGLDYTPQGIRSALRGIKTFFQWCELAGLVEKSPAASVTAPKVARAEIKILTVEGCRALMDKAAKSCPQVVPFLALQLFGGLRAAEAARVRAESIANGYVRIVGADTKLNTVRIVPVTPQLAAWLAVPGGEFLPQHKCYRLLSRLGLKLEKNALRHSFCTYLYALGSDIDAVAKAAGNSAEVLRRHYLGLATKEGGAEFAAIMPKN